MAHNNVCRLTATNAVEQLYTHCFVKEIHIKNLTTTLKHHRLMLCARGSGTLHIEDESVPFSLGSLIFVFAGEHMSVEQSDECEMMYVDFSGTRAESLFSRFAIGHLRRSFHGFEGMIPLWSESLTRSDDTAVDLAAESILLYTFSRLQGVGERETLLRRLIDYTEENFHNTNFSLSTLAEVFSYSPKYLSHLFRTQTGVTFTEYLRSLRIRYAITLFDHGIESVKSVALLSGFSDPLYFSSVFKGAVGVSPKEYQRKS